ncbi:MAG: sulfatase-like hydrolase/transferase [Bacteroidota bacterium]|nr:sulfatase-like hydrolase/transferase [Bacteroidota bacterium]
MKIKYIFFPDTILSLLKKLGIVLLLYTICRLLFYIFNKQYFTEINYEEFLKLFFWGLRFDISAIVILNSLYILLNIIPFSLRSRNYYQNICSIIFYITNFAGLLANLGDIAYYRFSFRRSTSDIFKIVTTGNDFLMLLPQYLKDYWYLLVFLILFVAILFMTGAKIPTDTKRNDCLPKKKRYLFDTINFVIMLILFIVGARGGIQYKNINITSASKYVSSGNIPLILNTPFAIIKTLNKESIHEFNYFNNSKLNDYYNPVHCNISSTTLKRKNVVIIILESFSKEHIGYLNGSKEKSYTPFLDSLSKKSMVFRNGFANGKRSIEALPAILAGIPTLMNEPYITSVYARNRIIALPEILKKEGYQTSFFHGGTNGTMNFDKLCKIAGVDKYYGRSEYNNEKDFDGEWGISDGPFFKYFARELNGMKQPFFSSIFSLSSHHPYKIPNGFNTSGFANLKPVQKSIMYTDHSLKEFFDLASKMKWFNNTIFIITADHTSEIINSQNENSVGIFHIPFILYSHDQNLKGFSDEIVQQTDIMSTVINYLGIKCCYVNFGNNMLNKMSEHFAINYLNDNYQFIYKDYIMTFNGKEIIGFYNYKRDPLLKTNLIQNNVNDLKTHNEILIKDHIENTLKAFIQTYNYRLINNKMTANN